MICISEYYKRGEVTSLIESVGIKVYHILGIAIGFVLLR